MNHFKTFALIASGFTLFLLLTGCGNSATNTSAAASTTTCSTGYSYSSVYAQCLEQTTACTGVDALYNGTCVYAATTTSTTTTTCSSGYVYSSIYAACLEQTTSCEGLYAIYSGSCVLYSSTTTTTTTTSTKSPYEGTCTTYGYVQTAECCLTQGACTTGYGFGYYYGEAWCFPTTASY